jgi:hypothetical protein
MNQQPCGHLYDQHRKKIKKYFCYILDAINIGKACPVTCQACTYGKVEIEG